MMKRFAILFIFVMATPFIIPLSAQNISTVAEIYNFEIGDVFHERYYESVDIYWVERLSSRTVVDKYYGPEGDTLYYDFEVEQMEMGIENPEWVYTISTYTTSYANLDSLINDGQIDSVSTDPNLYNGRLINYYEFDNYPNTNTRYRYVNGCGRAYHSYHGYGFGFSETELLYYNKGGEEWGNPILLLNTSEVDMDLKIHIYPNPADEFINVQIPSNETVELSMFNLMGKKVKTVSLNNKVSMIPTADLTLGIYFLVMETGQGVVSSKFVKN